jgi:CelD/BcsL family acetyltransferase involved in cellulose biosynthesis
LRVREADDFQSFRGKWNSLLKNNLLGDNVFLTWEWLFTWWEHFGKGRKPLVLFVEDGDEILAIAPLMLSEYKLPGFGTVKKVEFIGTRHSDYGNFIILRRATECLKLIIDHLLDTITDWDWIELKEVPETNENAAYLKTLFSNSPKGLELKKRVCNVCPYISLPNSFDLLMRGLSKNMRQNIRKYSKKVGKQYHLELNKYDEAGFSVKTAMDLFIKLHEMRWVSKDLPGVFREDTLRAFHMNVAECLAKEGWLGLYFLMADGEPVSAQYTYEYGQKMYYYLAGFDPNCSDYSIGNLTTFALLEKCMEKGFREYDMMRGNESYKLMWTRTCRNNFEIRFLRNGLSNKFYHWATWNNTTSNLAGKLGLTLKKGCI